MNRSFENIFEKYNISLQTPRKRQRYSKPEFSILHRRSLPTTTKIEAENSKLYSVSNTKGLNMSTSCYLNHRSKTKYNAPTRYKRLEVTEVGSEAKLQNYSLTEYFALDENDHSKSHENYFPLVEKKQSKQQKICDTYGTSNVSETKTALGSIENINNIKRNSLPDCLKISDEKLPRKNNVDDSLGMNETNLFTRENSFTNSSVCVNTTQNTQNGPSELDLLIDLIEQNGQNNKRDHPMSKQNRKTSNYGERLLVTKPRLKGGLQEMFERSLKHVKTKSNFLEHDKKFGLQVGQLLTVVKIETFHGITVAIVESQDLNKNSAIVVPREMVSHLKLESRVEAFFDDMTHPYKLLLNGEQFDVYLEPYKLLVA